MSIRPILFFYVNNKYLDYLNFNFDSSVARGNFNDLAVYAGPVLKVDGINFFVPLTTSKQQVYFMANPVAPGKTVLPINASVNGQVLPCGFGLADFGKMLPVPEGMYVPAGTGLTSLEGVVFNKNIPLKPNELRYFQNLALNNEGTLMGIYEMSANTYEEYYLSKAGQIKAQKTLNFNELLGGAKDFTLDMGRYKTEEVPIMRAFNDEIEAVKRRRDDEGKKFVVDPDKPVKNKRNAPAEQPRVKEQIFDINVTEYSSVNGTDIKINHEMRDYKKREQQANEQAELARAREREALEIAKKVDEILPEILANLSKYEKKPGAENAEKDTVKEFKQNMKTVVGEAIKKDEQKRTEEKIAAQQEKKQPAKEEKIKKATGKKTQEQN